MIDIYIFIQGLFFPIQICISMFLFPASSFGCLRSNSNLTSQNKLLIILSKIISFSVIHFILSSPKFKFKTLSIDSFLIHPISNLSANLIVSICNYIHNPSFSSYLPLPLWSEPPSSGRAFKVICLLPPLPYAPLPPFSYSPQSNQNNPLKM